MTLVIVGLNTYHLYQSIVDSEAHKLIMFELEQTQKKEGTIHVACTCHDLPFELSIDSFDLIFKWGKATNVSISEILHQHGTLHQQR